MLIEIDGISVEVTRKSIKNMNLRIYPPDGTVKISAPYSFKMQHIEGFIREKSAWIKEKQNLLHQKSPNKQEAKLSTGASIPFQGKNYLLILKEHEGPQHIEIMGELLHCYTKINAPSNTAAQLLDAWYKQKMQEILPPIIKHWEEIIGVEAAQWGIKKMKTRWGSCNTRAHRIWLNLNLIKKPLICLEYVLVHELVHLHEASHNSRFYALMSKFMPQWKEYQKLLETL